MPESKPHTEFEESSMKPVSKQHFVITFGNSQLPGLGYYTTVYAENRKQAREIMNNITTRWSFLYDSEDAAGVEKWNLKRVDLAEVKRMVAAAKLY